MPELKDRLQQALGAAYRIERELPAGGMSRVFLATEVRLSRKVVVKVLPPDMGNASQVERFAREIEVAASLQHPHIVSLLTAGSEGELAWYIMPFITGETLATKVQRDGALPVQEAVRILRDVVDALAYSHANGIVHRDIKPANVMFSGKHALVADFGVAKALSVLSGGHGGMTGIGITVGTPTYMAPEQAAADPHVDHRADIYSVGVMAYEMLTGRTPFLASTPQAMLAAHVTSFPDPIAQHRPSLPPALAAAVMKCLAKLPGDRWQSAEELAGMLEAYGTPSGGMTPIATAAVPGYVPEGPVGTGKVAALFVIATVVVVGTIFAATRVFGLPDWVWWGSAALMLAGFPIVMYTGRVERKRAQATMPGITVSGANRPHHAFFTWRRAITGGAVALALLLLATVGYAGARALGIGPAGTLLSSGAVGAGDRFVLADFVNRTSDSTIGSSITEALRVDLGQSQVVRIVGDREVAAAIQRMTLPAGTPVTDSVALDLARREGVKAVISGEVAPLGTGYVLTARVVDASTGATQTAVRATANDPSTLLSALNDLSAQLRERIGESLKAIRASEPLEQVTTSSLVALQHHTAALRAGAVADWAKAKEESELAIAADPQFAMAYRRLAGALNNMNAPRSQVLAATTKAFEFRDRLPPLERGLTELSYYYDVAQDWERAVTASRAVLAIDSLQNGALSALALLSVQMERFPEGEAAARRALKIRKSQSSAQSLLVALVGQRNWASAESLAAAVDTMWPDGPMMSSYFRGAIAYGRHDVQALDSVLRTAPPMKGDNSIWGINLDYQSTDLPLLQGRIEAANAEVVRMVAARGEEVGPGQSLNFLLFRPYTNLVARGDTVAARSELTVLLRRYPLASIPVADRPYVALRDIYAKLRDPAALQRLRADFEGAIPVGERALGDALAWELAEAEARGDERAALDLVRRWRAASFCSSCKASDEATWWERAGKPDSALAALQRLVDEPPDQFGDNYVGLYYGPSLYHAGTLAEALGDRAKARDYYQRFADDWRNAEPDFQPRVAEAKRRLASLGTDTPRP